MTKDDKTLRKKIQRPTKFYEPVDPAKKTHRDAEKRRRYNIALWFNKLQDLMDPGKSRKYKREHILTWTTNRIWVLMRDERIQEVSEKGELEDRLDKLEQSIKSKREIERQLQADLNHRKTVLNKDDDPDCYSDDTSYMTCQYIAPSATPLPSHFPAGVDQMFNPYLASLYSMQGSQSSPVILTTTTPEGLVAMCPLDNNRVEWGSQEKTGKPTIEEIKDLEPEVEDESSNQTEELSTVQELGISTAQELGISTEELAAQSLELSEELADQSLELTEELNQTGQSLRIDQSGDQSMNEEVQPTECVPFEQIADEGTSEDTITNRTDEPCTEDLQSIQYTSQLIANIFESDSELETSSDSVQEL